MGRGRGERREGDGGRGGEGVVLRGMPFRETMDSGLLAGAAAVEIDDDGNAWVLNGIANSVNRIDLLD